MLGLHWVPGVLQTECAAASFPSVGAAGAAIIAPPAVAALLAAVAVVATLLAVVVASAPLSVVARLTAVGGAWRAAVVTAALSRGMIAVPSVVLTSLAAPATAVVVAAPLVPVDDVAVVVPSAGAETLLHVGDGAQRRVVRPIAQVRDVPRSIAIGVVAGGNLASGVVEPPPHVRVRRGDSRRKTFQKFAVRGIPGAEGAANCGAAQICCAACWRGGGDVQAPLALRQWVVGASVGLRAVLGVRGLALPGLF